MYILLEVELMPILDISTSLLGRVSASSNGQTGETDH